MQVLHDGTAEAVMQNVVFYCADDLNAAGKKLESPGVEWLNPAWIDQGDRDTLFFQFFGRCLGDSNMFPNPKMATSRPC